jgi:hypothetical protein
MRRPSFCVAYQVSSPGRVCEDAYAFDVARGRYAVADGASFSFAPALWASILTRGFVDERTKGSRLFPCLCSDRYRRAVLGGDRRMRKADTVQRGSYAAFAGVRLLRGSFFAEVWALGDSVAFLCEDGNPVDWFPRLSPGDFSHDSELVPSARKGSLRFERALFKLKGLFRPGILLATDAAALWILSALDAKMPPEMLISPLLRLDPEAPFRFGKAVRDLQDSSSLRRDDITLLYVR